MKNYDNAQELTRTEGNINYFNFEFINLFYCEPR